MPREILNLPEVDGALVGGASLKAEDFLAHYRRSVKARLTRPLRPFLNTARRILPAIKAKGVVGNGRCLSTVSRR